ALGRPRAAPAARVASRARLARHRHRARGPGARPPHMDARRTDGDDVPDGAAAGGGTARYRGAPPHRGSAPPRTAGVRARARPHGAARTDRSPRQPSSRRPGLWHALAVGALIAGALPSHARAQVDPAADYRTLHTAHFRVTYQRGLEALAHHAAERAEMAHAALRGTLAPAPRGMIDIVLADDLDLT